MNNKIKITSLELENVKRVSVVQIEPTENGLTIIGGDNAQGKTSILDGICFALGGEKYRPSKLQKDESLAEPYIKLTLSNGLIVERKGKNASLKVVDPTGAKAGQSLLDSFISEFALNLPKFMQATSADKAKVLLQILGIDQELAVIEKEEQAAYNERTIQGRIADQKEKYAKEMPEYHHDVPDMPITAAELIEQQQELLLKNAETRKIKDNLELNKKKTSDLVEEKVRILKRLAEINSLLDDLHKSIETAQTTKLVIYPTTEIEKQIADIEETNAKIRENLNKKKAIEDAKDARTECDKLTAKVEAVREKRKALLSSAKMPLPGLSVENGELVLNGKNWDCMSSSEQMKAATAIIKALNPLCGFLLLDKLECMDIKTLTEFNIWLKGENLQAIATRVSKGEECSIIIEDGKAVATEEITQKIEKEGINFKEGEF